jgi:uncharacterized protein YheU (UPF0270 family)
MLIPHTKLSEQVLRALIEEYVSREGTDYGGTAYSLDSKVEAVLRQLESGVAGIVFDPISETCDIVSTSSARYRDLGKTLETPEDSD